jgi:hypothetical protein
VFFSCAFLLRITFFVTEIVEIELYYYLILMNSGIFRQVLEFLALRGILTAEKINEGHPIAGKERLDCSNL